MPNAWSGHASDARLPIAWVVSGPLRQLTGGYLYDAHIVDGLRASGWRVGVVNIRLERWPLDQAGARHLHGALRRTRWGAVIVDELAHPAVAAAVLTGRLGSALGGAPLVLLVHHLRCSEPGPRPTRLLAHVVERLVLRAADLIVCTSATTARTVRPLVGRAAAVEVVRPGWNTHEDYRGQGTGDGRSEGGRLRVLLVAHWTPRKGILDALRAINRAPDGVSLDLVGQTDRDPAYAAQVRRALRSSSLAGRVCVHGQVTSSRLAELYHAADALLLCSNHEGYGMVLAEGLAAGLPVVATRVGAVPEVVRDGLEAELVEPGDIAGLARALARLVNDPDERQRRAGLARDRATHLPTWDQSVVAFDNLVRRLTRPGCGEPGHGI
jgi:glycosyltransferase involved in cell wall biosynthesis